MGIKEKLQGLMNKAGLNASQLAEKAGLPKSTVYAILKRDSSNVSYVTAQKLAKALKCNETEFLNLSYDDTAVYEDLRKEFNRLKESNIDPSIKEYEISELLIDVFELLEKYNIEYDGAPLTDLYNSFELLNIDGQYEAAKRVEELTHIEKYIKKDPKG